MAAPTLGLRPIEDTDHDRWHDLYRQYCEFYSIPLTPDKAGTVWGWLRDDGHVLEGRVITADGAVVGLCHFRAFPAPLAGTDAGFLDDLYVDPSSRGQGIAEYALRELIGLTADRGWVSLQWLTADDNYRARAVYDKVATRTHWLTYEVEP